MVASEKDQTAARLIRGNSCHARQLIMLMWRVFTSAAQEASMENDSTIRTRVMEELEFDPRLSDDGIGVAVCNGIATLSGHVPSLAQKAFAGNAARRVREVRGVAQELVVTLADDEKLDDDEIAERALNSLKWGVGASRNIKVIVDGTSATLSGKVKAWHEKQLVTDAAWAIPGVTAVHDNLIL